ncbi:hypothetical protein MTP99_003136 [Tenebrio molitor]|jgi:hypothetical protein|nr:hypothetical protein MTP99_003136 [Tenebrio molitor]
MMMARVGTIHSKEGTTRGIGCERYKIDVLVLCYFIRKSLKCYQLQVEIPSVVGGLAITQASLMRPEKALPAMRFFLLYELLSDMTAAEAES